MNIAKVCVVSIMVALAGCTLPPPEQPVSPNFVFNPPSSSSATKNAMSIAILLPGTSGSFFEDKSNESLSLKFINAAQVDLEKILISKGFTISGSFRSYDEMTYSQKEKSTLIMRPTISYNIDLRRGGFGQGSMATVRGSVAVEFLEPLSKEKVWIKHFDLPETTQQVQVGLARGADGNLIKGPDGGLLYSITLNSATNLLNSFYASSFNRLWEQLDEREIVSLRSDANKLKSRSNYRAN